MKPDLTQWRWTRPPRSASILDGRVTITTDPHTDLWQRTYYRFRNDSAPLLQTTTDDPSFSFIVKTRFDGTHRFDQCGIVMYLDAENWLKAGIEYENEEYAHLGSVVTDHGYSDWATTRIDSGITALWYRLSRRDDDFRIESSLDGSSFTQMRICHMREASGTIHFGIYACSPEDSSFTAAFSHMEILDCQWPAHDGQAPDPDEA